MPKPGTELSKPSPTDETQRKLQEARVQMVDALPLAVATLISVMMDDSASHDSRIKAASKVIDSSLPRQRDDIDVADLARLVEAIAGPADPETIDVEADE